MHKNAIQRLQILEILYHAFAQSPDFCWVSEFELRKMGEIEFTLAALKKLGLADREGFNWQITGAGMLAYEDAQKV